MRTYCLIIRNKLRAFRDRIGYDKSIERIADRRLSQRPCHYSRKWRGILLKADGLVKIGENLAGRGAEPADFPQIDHFKQYNRRDREVRVLKDIDHQTRKATKLSLVKPNGPMCIEMNHHPT